MSESNDDPKSKRNPRGLSASVLDAIPTAEEGDALFDMLFDAPAPLPIAEAAPVVEAVPVVEEALDAPPPSPSEEPSHAADALALQADDEASVRPVDAELSASEEDWIGFDPILEGAKLSSADEAAPGEPSNPSAPSVGDDGEVVAPPGWPFTPLGSPRTPSVKPTEAAVGIAEANAQEPELELGDALFDDPSVAPQVTAAQAIVQPSAGDKEPTEDDAALDALVAAGLSLDDLAPENEPPAPRDATDASSPAPEADHAEAAAPSSTDAAPPSAPTTASSSDDDDFGALAELFEEPEWGAAESAAPGVANASVDDVEDVDPSELLDPSKLFDSSEPVASSVEIVEGAVDASPLERDAVSADDLDSEAEEVDPSELLEPSWAAGPVEERNAPPPSADSAPGPEMPARDVSEAAARDASEAAARDASEVALGDASEAAARDASEAAARDAAEVAARDASEAAARDASEAAARDASEAALGDASEVAARDASEVAARDASEVAARDASEVAARADGVVEGAIVDGAADSPEPHASEGDANEARAAVEPSLVEVGATHSAPSDVAPPLPPALAKPLAPPVAALDDDPCSHDAMLERLAWLRDEATLRASNSASGHGADASLWLVIAEHEARAGSEQAAADATERALALAPKAWIASFLGRAYAARRGDWAHVVGRLDVEARELPSVDARAHASMLGALVLRHVLSDADAANKRIELAARLAPDDPRPLVARIAAATTHPQAAEVLARLASTTSARPELREAVHDLVACRRADSEGPVSITNFAVVARGALERGGNGELRAAFGALRGTELEVACRWIEGVIAAARPESREEAIAALSDVAASGNFPSADRLLRTLRIESGLGVGALATAGDDSPEGLLLRALARAMAPEAAPFDRGSFARGADASEPATRALLAAATHAFERDPAARVAALDEIGPLDASSRATVRLGRLLGSSRLRERGLVESLSQAADSLLDHLDPLRIEHGAFLRALTLELDLERIDAPKIADGLVALGGSTSPLRFALAALLLEAAGEHEFALAHLRDAVAADPTFESAVRALGAHEPPAEFIRRLETLAAKCEPEVRPRLAAEVAVRAWLLADAHAAHEAEGALRRAADASALALEHDPTSVVLLHVRELVGRALQDRSIADDARERRIALADDPHEEAFERVRAALRCADDPARASEQLGRVLASHPEQLAIVAWAERIGLDPLPVRAARRAALAERVEGTLRDDQLVLAAYLHDAAGDLAAAASLLVKDDASAAAPALLERLVRAGEGGEVARSRVLEALQSESVAEPPAAVHRHLASLHAELLAWDDQRKELEAARELDGLDPIALRALLVASARTSPLATLEPTVLALAHAHDDGLGAAYSELAAHFASTRGGAASRRAVELAYGRLPRPSWAVRALGELALAAHEPALASECAAELLLRSDRPGDRAILALRAAETALAAREPERARALLSEVVDDVPGFAQPRIVLASIELELGEVARASEQLELAAASTSDEGIRLDTLVRAGVLLHERLHDLEGARVVLEPVFRARPDDDALFERLRSIYDALGARSELAELLRTRVAAVRDPARRVELEVERGRALRAVGEAELAKRALAAALDEQPDHAVALDAFAELCVAEEDFEGAEQALIRLARLTTEPEAQAAIYLRLGLLYDDHLDNPDRAEVAYAEVVKRRPGDVPARRRLVELHWRMGQRPRAIEGQAKLVELATDPDDKAVRSVELAELIERSGDAKRAEAALLAARKALPRSDAVLVALARLYERTGQQAAAVALLDRAVSDARRALATGRFEPFLFGTLAAVANARAEYAAGSVLRASLDCLEGTPSEEGDSVFGVGDAAGSPDVDDLLAPELVTPAMRSLLASTGALLDEAYPYDVDAVRALPLPPPLAPLGVEAREIAEAYGVAGLEVLTSKVLGPVCIAARASSPTIVLGHALAQQQPSPERTFLLHRAMKLIQANAAVLARTAPIDLWPVLAAYLKRLAPSFVPQGVDAARLADATARLARVKAPAATPEQAALAVEVAASLGARASALHGALNAWGARTALLAVGDPRPAVVALAWVSGSAGGPPASGKERLTWLTRNAEARDILVYSASEAYLAARVRAVGG